MNLRFASVIAGFGLAFSTACGSSEPAAQPSAAAPTPAAPAPAAEPVSGSGEIAAEVNGRAITMDEVDEWVKEDFFRSRASNPNKLYELRERGLEGLIEERILEAEAQKRGVAPDAVLESTVAELGPVTDEEVDAFFIANEERLGGATLDQVSDRIREYLTSRRESDAMEKIREAAEVKIIMEPPRVEIAAAGPSKGPDDARVTIIEFSDFECPFCQRAIPILDQVLKKYPNDVRLVYRNMPIRGHDRARPAAEAALCANDQGKFWPYHDLLFENSRELSDEDLRRYADQVGLDGEIFEKCVSEEKYAAQIDEDMKDARTAGITGTPAFLVNGILISGAKPADEFYKLIDAELARQGSS